MDVPRPMMKEKNRLQNDIIKYVTLYMQFGNVKNKLYYLWVHMYLTIM